MRRIAICVLMIAMLAQPVDAAEKKKYISLTFDDGPAGKYTEILLDGLQLRGVKATFLLCGYRMQHYSGLAQRIFDEGHEIGYHGFSHKTMQNMSRRTIAQELIDSRALMPEDCDPVFFRPPGGVVTDGVRQVAEARNLAILSWSVDPRDWATDNEEAVEKAVLQNVKDGDVILLHDMSYSSVRAALDIVDALQEQDYRFVTVSELARLRKISIRAGKRYTAFPPEHEKEMK